MQRKRIDKGGKTKRGETCSWRHIIKPHTFPNQALVLSSPFYLAGKDTNTISSKEQYALNEIISNAELLTQL